ncbi:hypothetical protein [Formosimonas limnophila]|uniref:hypothetical protein n=1 Tax=Formosimonas limnophila TaxID=1384487 RepID=UPI001E43F306|nr:hypothetical protein [Formosimonas limnophila]
MNNEMHLGFKSPSDRYKEALYAGDVAAMEKLQKEFPGVFTSAEKNMSDLRQAELNQAGIERFINEKCGGLSNTQCQTAISNWLTQGDQRALAIFGGTLALGGPSAIRALISAYKAGKEVWDTKYFGRNEPFGSKDPMVNNTANRLNNEIPGAVSGVGVRISGAGRTSDADVMLTNGVMIEVKSGGGTGINSQVAKQAEIMGGKDKIIVYAPDIGGAAQRQLISNGYKVFRNMEDLIKYIKQIF